MHNPCVAKYSDVTGVLLDGGKSRRMGLDKAAWVVNDQALYSRSLALLCRYLHKVIISGNRPDLTSEKIPCVPDMFPGSAFGGIYTMSLFMTLTMPRGFVT